MTEAAVAATEADAPAEQEWTEDKPSAISAIWHACEVLAEKSDVIASKMKVRRKQVLEKAETLEKSAQRILLRLEENKAVGPAEPCKDFASNGYLIGELLKIGIDDEEAFTKLRNDTMSGMSGRRLVFEIELVAIPDKDLLVEGWRKCVADLTKTRETLAQP